MHPDFLNYLCCPVTRGELRLEVSEFNSNGTVKTGRLVCDGAGTAYPILRGIPRFVDQELYSSSFGYEWRRWPRVQFESENVGRPMAGHTTRMFSTITGLCEAEVRGRALVEFGCGPGRFLDIVRSWGGIAVGIDMSLAVESARENFSEDGKVLVVQGDILKPPFKKDIFDHGYTIGVLHHTPDPALGLQILADVVRPGGSIACCVYSKKGFYHYPSVQLFKKIHNTLADLCGSAVATRLALGYSLCAAHLLYPIFGLLGKVPFLGPRGVHVIGKYLLVNLALPDVRWRVLDVFDAITPRYASTHTAGELRAWFQSAGCLNIEPQDWGDTSFTARKQPRSLAATLNLDGPCAE